VVDGVAQRSTLQHVAQRLRESNVTLAQQWLHRVAELLSFSDRAVFPSQGLLDHILDVITEIAAHVEAAPGARLENNAAVVARAAELGELRHVQHASVQQVIAEYRALAESLEQFVEGEIAAMESVDPRDAVVAFRRVGESVRVMQQHTLDALVSNYTELIEQQTAQLRHFSRLVSHEVRQPLAVLQVIIRALPVPTGDEQSARMMDIFERSVLRLADVTGKLERLARITQATAMSPSERQVDLGEVAHTVAAQLADAAGQRGVDIHVQPNLPVLRIDPARAELIFLNLVGNAVKYADPAKPVRYVEIYQAPGDSPNVIVRDNGVGMAPARLQTIFREFVRAHAQRHDDVRTSGLGLGLSIVRECMDHANGSVRVDSIEGRGTTFKLMWAKPAEATR
jgi:signal transduction histidine kinase